MNTIDWSNYKFHASSVKNLMVESRSKTDPLSETTKAYLQGIFIQEVFGRKKMVTSAPMQKGTMAESDGLSLVHQVKGTLYFKNQKQFSNEFVCGTPDVIDEQAQAIRDMKLSWDIWTFAKSNEKTARDDYYWQILCYAWMKGFSKGSIIYALVTTPTLLMNDELYRASFKATEEELEKLKPNYVYDDIDPNLRVKQCDFDIDADDIERLKSKILLARDYLKGLSL